MSNMMLATFMSLLCFFCLLLPTVSQASKSEADILLNLATELRSPVGSALASWRPGGSPCSFMGVTCNSEGSVLEIDLADQMLSGRLPLGSLCQLKSLQKLDVGGNSLQGTISEALNNCTNLRYLSLSMNQFTGPFPDISSLTELQYLFLEAGGFSGNFPWSSLTNMKSLIVLAIGDNSFNPSPFPGAVLELYNLRLLYMSNCSLGGIIPPEIGQLTDLVDFQIADNDFRGEIPSTVGNLTNLLQLELYNNRLTGRLPVGLRNLTKLEKFDVSTNELDGDLSELRFLKSLRSLQLHHNRFSGSVPSEFGELQQLVNLTLYTNNLSGKLPWKLGSSGATNLIDVARNSFTGPIPPDMCHKGSLSYLSLEENNFSGPIPSNYESCTTLVTFQVRNNSLSGRVPPGVWGLPCLYIIDISMNRLEGTISPNIRAARSLVQLYLSQNNLSGEIPEQISGAQLLAEINLSYNNFSGKIPRTIGELKALTYLNLSRNELEGRIPSTMSSLNISQLDLSNNRLYGPISKALLKVSGERGVSGNQGLCKPIGPFDPCYLDSRKRTYIIGASIFLGTLRVAWVLFEFLY